MGFGGSNIFSVQGFGFCCGYIIDRNRESSLLFIVCEYDLHLPLPRTFNGSCCFYLKSMLELNLEFVFFLNGALGVRTPPKKTWSVKNTRKSVGRSGRFSQRMGHLWRCQLVPSTLANLAPTVPEAQDIFGRLRRGIFTTDWIHNF